MAALKQELGNRYGRLQVAGPDPAGRPAYWLCACDCGSDVVVFGGALRSGNTKSCGCGRGTHRHTVGRRYHPLYWTWSNMRKRCYSPSRDEYASYGGRGISICDRWRDSFADFLADVGERPSPQHSLDRIDNDGNYEPGNVRWATKSEQLANRRCTSDPCARHRAALEARITELEDQLCRQS
jgi:hypothetical protein